MFTGLVEAVCPVEAVVNEPPGVKLMIRIGDLGANIQLGDSIAINGCCLTVVAIEADVIALEAGAETLSRTNLGELASGGKVNIERSLVVGERLGGHFVTGHIDGIGRLESREDDKKWSTFWISAGAKLSKQMASKGSIAVDGVSLTLVEVQADRFSVALIPHTLEVTTLGSLTVGSRVNLETDVLAKYVERQLSFNS